MRRVLLSLLLVACASPAPAQNLRVRSGESIAAALELAKPGMVIEVEPGIYHEALVVDTPNITLRGIVRGAERPVLDGRGTLNDGVIASGSPFTMTGFAVRHYKGNGVTTVAPGAPLVSPDFARDGGEEPEIAGIYVVGDDGTPLRVGFALANEFSDHVTERMNYLYLAHSKLRNASFGPEILVGELPADIRGTSLILRGGKTLWEKPFLSGEANMSHTIANLEHHHFKYALFRQPGDIHVHMFGTATLSFADGIKTEPGDVFEISAPDFGLPLRNALDIAPAGPATVRAL